MHYVKNLKMLKIRDEEETKAYYCRAEETALFDKGNVLTAGVRILILIEFAGSKEKH